jgi:hypothetical protein
MRTAPITVCGATFLLLGLAATLGCGPSKPAQDATSADEGLDTSTGQKLTPEQVAEKRRQRQERDAEDAARDPDSKKGSSKAVECKVVNTAELQPLLSRPECEVHDSEATTKERDLNEVLTVKATTEGGTVAPGGQLKVTVTFTNKGKEPLPLDFKLDPEPRFIMELYTPKGARAELPPGDEPMLPPEATGGLALEPGVARATLTPGSSGRVLLTWNAVKYKWANKDKARGAVRGHGYPREAAGSLPKGKYVLKVVTPLIGVFEGIEHSLSQPTVPIEVKD